MPGVIRSERLQNRDLLISLYGQVDYSQADELRAQLANVIESEQSDLLVDLSDASFIDSSILGALLGAQKRLRTDGGRLALVITHPDVRRVFAITTLDRVFTIYPTRKDALAPSQD